MAADNDPKDITAADRAYQAAVEASSVKTEAAPGNVVAAKAKKTRERPKVSKAEVPAVDVPAVDVPAVDVPAVDVPKVDAPVVNASAAKEISPPQETAAPATGTAFAAGAKAEQVKVRNRDKADKALAKPRRVMGAAVVAKAKKPIKAEKNVPVKAATPKPAVKVAGATDRPKTPVTRPAAATHKGAKNAPISTFAGLFTQFMLEDKTMDMSGNFSGFQNAVTEAQAKAKDVFEKSTKVFGEVGDFTKGNDEAVMESGKILAEGVQSLGSEIVAEGRTAFETMSGDIKELAAAKSPTDFFKIQSDMMRKNFDSAVAYGSKNSEAMLKLVSDVMAPISGRVSLAMEKARSASL